MKILYQLYLVLIHNVLLICSKSSQSILKYIIVKLIGVMHCLCYINSNALAYGPKKDLTHVHNVLSSMNSKILKLWRTLGVKIISVRLLPFKFHDWLVLTYFCTNRYSRNDKKLNSPFLLTDRYTHIVYYNKLLNVVLLFIIVTRAAGGEWVTKTIIPYR